MAAPWVWCDRKDPFEYSRNFGFPLHNCSLLKFWLQEFKIQAPKGLFCRSCSLFVSMSENLAGLGKWPGLMFNCQFCLPWGISVQLHPITSSALTLPWAGALLQPPGTAQSAAGQGKLPCPPCDVPGNTWLQWHLPCVVGTSLPLTRLQRSSCFLLFPSWNLIRFEFYCEGNTIIT